MTPKEKAVELVYGFIEKIPFADKNVYKDWKKEMNDKAQQCALIAVEEIRDLMNRLQNYEQAVYWKEVKEEIDRL